MEEISRSFLLSLGVAISDLGTCAVSWFFGSGVSRTDLTAALPSPVWQKRNRTSRRPLPKANLADISFFRLGVGLQSSVVEECPSKAIKVPKSVASSSGPCVESLKVSLLIV